MTSPGDKLILFATWEITLPEYIGAWGLSEFVKYGDFNVTLLLDGVCHKDLSNMGSYILRERDLPCRE